MKSSKSNNAISVTTFFCFRYLRYNISAKVNGLADNSGDGNICAECHSALENQASGIYILLSGYPCQQ